MNQIEYQLQSVDQISGGTFFRCKLVHAISPKGETTKFLKSKKTGLRWKINSIAFLPAKRVQAGYRLYGVAPLQSESNVAKGEILIGETE